MGLVLPSEDEARQFALMITTGLPAPDAMRYFLPDDTHPDIVAELAARWVNCAAVKKALVALNKGAWTELTPEERIKLALDKHYNEMAYYLYTSNYGELEGPRKSKADSCRVALETKLAGMAGKMDALARFYVDMQEKQERDKRKSTTH